MIMSDNGPQFTSGAMREFLQQWEVSHVTSSPTHAQSNGQAERCIQTVKNLMKRAKMSNQDPMYALLEYRNTPIDGMRGYAPAQILNGRLLRSQIPVSESALRPQNIPPLHDDLVVARQSKQATYFNARARPTPFPSLITVKNNCKLTGFLACKITSFGRFSIITVFFL